MIITAFLFCTLVASNYSADYALNDIKKGEKLSKKEGLKKAIKETWDQQWIFFIIVAVVEIASLIGLNYYLSQAKSVISEIIQTAQSQK